MQWEPGFGDDESYWVGWPEEEITIADDPSNQDEWDDSVIIHEWAHLSDYEYGCNDTPSETHSREALLDSALAWGEGYANYYQSAVRHTNGYTNAEYLIDVRADVITGANLEDWHTHRPDLVSVRNEIAVAAALWDFYDLVDDDQDTVYHGQGRIQEVFTSGVFEDMADDCDFDSFAKAWVAKGMPADKDTAAAILQNTGYTLPASTQMTKQSTTAAASSAPLGPTESIWWNQLTYVVDNSFSMNGSKLNAVKSVLAETLSDLGAEPEGTNFTLHTFNNLNNDNQVVFAGQFFPERLTAAVSGLSTSGGIAPCQVDALKALAQGVDNQYKGEVWLFTDGDTSTSNPSVENMVYMLNERMVHASIALMGICSTTARASTEQDLQAQRLLQGAAKAYLGTAAVTETPGGVVPYLLTAIGSGGQFLYVDPDQAQYAADILQAQITHSAGAGTWSDYVSDQATYRWDYLPTFEYNWIDASPLNGGTDWGTPPSEGYINVTIPDGFRFYEMGPFPIAHVYEDGYMTLGNYFGSVQSNTYLPNMATPNNAIYPYWDSLAWELACANAVNAPQDCGRTGKIYSKQEGDWLAIEYENFFPSDYPGDYNTFEVLLNSVNDEIRFQYHTVPNGAASATIGIENFLGNYGVEVSRDKTAGASDGMGYKLTPAPPQPTKTYTITADSLMQGIGFLLAGYDGSFEELVVRYPDGMQVDCGDTENVLCLDLGLVQYVQADVDGRTGDWHAVVDAGPTGSGTFSFFSMAAGALSVESFGDHSLSTADSTVLVLDLGQAVDGNTLTGWFTSPGDDPFGSSFTLYDDGAHGDGAAGDGRFGSAPYTPAGAGTAYLWVNGALDGVEFIRSDRVPFTFQPLSITSLGDGVNMGAITDLQFELRNDDVYSHCYQYVARIPEGWSLNMGSPPHVVCLNAGQTMIKAVQVAMDNDLPNYLPSGTSGEVVLSIVESEEGVMSDSASARVTRHRPPGSISIFNPRSTLRPNGDTSVLSFMVFDQQGVTVADGTEVSLSATLGTLSPITGTTQQGFFTATFASGAADGTAVIMAQVNAVSATTEIEIRSSQPDQITLETSSISLPADGTSTASLTATVLAPWGAPVPNQIVQIGVEGDGQMGTINGSEVISGTTDAAGQLLATFTSGEISGEANVRAELLALKGSDYRVVREQRQVITVGSRYVYLPLVLR